MMIDPLRNRISCSPLASRIPFDRPGSRCGAIALRFTIAWNERKVFVVVRLWCEVHTARVPGNSRHRPITIFPIVNVLPTWRGIDATTPPTVAAYLPFSRHPNMIEPNPCCQGSNSTPTSDRRRFTRGYTDVTIPSGITT
ncbi:Uncharacterised protein [Mycobacteroides abscessus subsp. abscessus]|nr:Uncharacterised protein [Mycobacteroides abscessus subsp. abscessus]SIM96580.1 Uncharacterised protein [Mycobacteroides abscessus subsp. abscessus]